MDTEVEDFLEHFGVKGQKWGVRKQNKKTGASTSTHLGKRSHDARKLSNSELKKVVERMELEQRYSRLNAQPASRGQAFARDFLQSNGTKIAAAVVLSGASAVVGRYLAPDHPSIATDIITRLAPRKK